MPKSPEELAHQEWLGYVQPVGLVVSIPAMLEAQCYVNKNIMAEHARFLSCVTDDNSASPQRQQATGTAANHSLALRACIRDLAEFTQKVLGWEAADLVEVSPRGPLSGDLATLEVVLPQYNETLRPTHAVPVFKPGEGQNPWMMLVQELAAGIDLDSTTESDSARHWNAAPQAKFERLLRETGVPIGLLSNRRQLRLVYAPKGESSGHATFNVDEMTQVAGRPMFAALHMLLGADRMFSLGDNQRLPAILENSRKYQNTVSTKLAEQVLAALYELMRGFQAANDVRNGDLLREVLASNPNHVYSGLLTVLMRLVFVMYAEDRNLLSSDPIYSNYYSVTGLFNRLREDAGRHPDTMHQRYGAWSQLITLFRLIYEGGQHGDFKLPARKGYLFDPERYPFLEGRASGVGVRDSRGTQYGSAIVSGSSSLADGNGSDGSDLRGDEVVSEGGTLRTDEPDSTRCDLDSSEHRRGLRQGERGVSAVSAHRAGEPDGTGNASDDFAKDRHPQRGSSESAPGNDRPPWPHADKAAARPTGLIRSPNPEPQIPRVSDGVVYNVLRNLLILDGERLSYRTLDVEQIGSVYETVMGFNLEVARGKSIAIKPVKTHGAPATINLEALLQAPGKDRVKWLKENADQTLGAVAAKSLKAATTIDELLEALDKKVAKKVTPRIVPLGAIVLQPSDERRRSGSHYTPRSLTEPIVRTTLEPILKQLITHPSEPQGASPGSVPSREPGLAPIGSLVNPRPIDKALKKRLTAGEIAERERLEQQRADHHTAAIRVGTPHPSQILDLKICDPAMGSGAFLVEACRQLGDHLIDAWAAHDLTPTDIPPDEDEVLYARRLVAQRCLYGVDKNEMAVDLAKLSLWLVTLAKDHPFTFLDHSLRHGDSLVGLSRQQIIGFHWEPKKQKQFGEELIQKRLDRATEARAKILNAREDVPYRDQERRMALAEEALSVVRLTADACVSAFFSESKKKDREARCEELFDDVALHYQNLQDGRFDRGVRDRIAQAAASLRTGEHPLPPFHWEIEFPEVFSRDNGGFDAFVGNPPFVGVKILGETTRYGYTDWMRESNENSGGKCDLVAFFFRGGFNQLRRRGTVGFVATKTIAQGDTRRSGLAYIVRSGGTLYAVTKRLAWPGQAAVIVSVIHLIKAGIEGPRQLDNKRVRRISSYLLESDYDDDPKPLAASTDFGFLGSKMVGLGFIIDDENTSCPTNAQIDEIIASRPASSCLVKPYIGGEELNSFAPVTYRKRAIDFGDLSEEEAGEHPELFQILETYVKPARQKSSGSQKKLWWQYAHKAHKLYQAISGLEKCIALAQYSQTFAFTFLDTHGVINSKIVAFATDKYSYFAILQSRLHESWARFLSGTLKDDLQYTPSACLVTFPFPDVASHENELDAGGRDFYDARTAEMLARNEGLTKTYNRFHDPHEKSPEIQKLRELHAAMDRVVLEAYGWHDLATSARCEFLLDYEEEDDGEPTGASPGSPRRSKKKKPWRLRWPDDFRDEVLARLLELNEQRHQEELLAGKSMKRTGSAPSPRRAKSDSPPAVDAPSLQLPGF